MVGRQALRSEFPIVSKDSLSTWRTSPSGPGKQTTWVYTWDLVRMGIMAESRTMIPVQGGVGNAKAGLSVQTLFPI